MPALDKEVSAQTAGGFEGAQLGVKSNLLHSRCGREAVLARRTGKKISASALHSVASPLHHWYGKNGHTYTKQSASFVLSGILCNAPR